MRDGATYVAPYLPKHLLPIQAAHQLYVLLAVTNLPDTAIRTRSFHEPGVRPIGHAKESAGLNSNPGQCLVSQAVASGTSSLKTATGVLEENARWMASR